MRTCSFVKVVLFTLSLGFALAVAGCGPRNFVNENDKLRRQNLELENELESVREKLARKTGQLQTLKARLGGPATQPSLAMESVLSTISLGGYSGPIDTDGDGQPDTLRLYVKTRDQEGRMLPVVAKATIQVVHIPDQGELRQLASTTYSNEQFNEAYRSSFTGRHYTLETDMPHPLPEGVDQITAKVILSHSNSGNRFTAQKTFNVSRQ